VENCWRAAWYVDATQFDGSQLCLPPMPAAAHVDCLNTASDIPATMVLVNGQVIEPEVTVSASCFSAYAAVRDTPATTSAQPAKLWLRHWQCKHCSVAKRPPNG
jgi:hypothetical protein